jgi:hypothetical protein
VSRLQPNQHEVQQLLPVWTARARLNLFERRLGAPEAEARYVEQERRDTTADGRRRAFVAAAGRPSADVKRSYRLAQAARSRSSFATSDHRGGDPGRWWQVLSTYRRPVAPEDH